MAGRDGRAEKFSSWWPGSKGKKQELSQVEPSKTSFPIADFLQLDPTSESFQNLPK
jgi:hypothetical protein